MKKQKQQFKNYIDRQQRLTYDSTAKKFQEWIIKTVYLIVISSCKTYAGYKEIIVLSYLVCHKLNNNAYTTTSRMHLTNSSTKHQLFIHPQNLQ